MLRSHLLDGEIFYYVELPELKFVMGQPAVGSHVPHINGLNRSVLSNEECLSSPVVLMWTPDSFREHLVSHGVTLRSEIRAGEVYRYGNEGVIFFVGPLAASCPSSPVAINDDGLIRQDWTRKVQLLWSPNPERPIFLYRNPYLSYGTASNQENLSFERTEMPAITPNLNSNQSHTPATDINPNALAVINITRNKQDHKLMLTVDAKPLHDILDRMGAIVVGDTYAERPTTNYRVAGNGALSTEIFLKRQYPNMVSLNGVFSVPPTLNKLKELCNTAHDAIKQILVHYQPVDIQVVVQKKAI